MMSDFENEVPPVLESKPTPPPGTSLLARLLNVLAMPGQVFEEVRPARHAAGNWLVPVPLYAVSLAVLTLVFFSTPTIQKLWQERLSLVRQAQATELAGAVQAGKIKPAQADETLALMDSMWRPRVVAAVVLVGGFGVGVARVFWWALVLWLLARAVLKRPIHYGKALEVTGLASVVALLGNLVIIALSVNFGKTFSGGSLTLSVADFESSRQQLVVAVAQNALNFWLIAVLGAGLARLTGLPWMRGAFLVVTYWMATELLLLLGVGFAR